MKNLSILLAEDNQDDEILALWVLRKAGLLRVTVVRDGQAALDTLFGEMSGAGECITTGLVLLDLRMPKISGIEVLKRLRSVERTKNLAVIVLTSSEDQKELDACHEQGVVAILAKPLTLEPFLHCLRKIPGVLP